MVIKQIEDISKSVVKVTTGEGQVIFIHRDFYDKDIVTGELHGDDESELLDAALCYVCLRKALDLLARAEHTRQLLFQKLQKRDFNRVYIERVLDYLEDKGTLSNKRFAEVFLATRKCEGGARLMAELQKRGVKKDIASDAVAEYFNNNDESALCDAAAKKLLRGNKDCNKVISALIRKGFSYKVIKGVLRSYDGDYN